MCQRRRRIFAIVAARISAGALSLAGSNEAGDPRFQADTIEKGAQLFAENCSMCHETKPHFRPEKLDATKKHMLDQIADLTPEEQQAILAFLVHDQQKAVETTQ
jgi:mono/diheme cytochrome c family protein